MSNKLLKSFIKFLLNEELTSEDTENLNRKKEFAESLANRLYDELQVGIGDFIINDNIKFFHNKVDINPASIGDYWINTKNNSKPSAEFRDLIGKIDFGMHFFNIEGKKYWGGKLEENDDIIQFSFSFHFQEVPNEKLQKKATGIVKFYFYPSFNKSVDQNTLEFKKTLLTHFEHEYHVFQQDKELLRKYSNFGPFDN